MEVGNSKTVRYEIVEETGFSHGLGEYYTYGIKAEEISEDVVVESYVLNDVTTDEDEARELVQLFTEEQLEIIHFKDVVEERIGM